MFFLLICFNLCLISCLPFYFFFFFFNDTATTEIYTLSLHDALPIRVLPGDCPTGVTKPGGGHCSRSEEHTSNSSHSQISYAVFCLKKKKKKEIKRIILKKKKKNKRTKNKTNKK